MSPRARILVVGVAVLAAAATAAALFPLASTRPVWADEGKGPPPAAPREPAKEAGLAAGGDELAAVRKTAEAFAAAFAKGDAAALAAFWTKEGEYTGPDGERLQGREAIEKDYRKFFAKHPKSTVEVQIETVRALGRHTVLEEGTLKVKVPGERSPGQSRYSVLHVREEDGWKMASVKEWLPDPARLVTLNDVAWLVGEWSAKSGDLRATMSYAWDEEKASLLGRHEFRRGDKVLSSGTQILRKDPNGGLRSWQFESSGSQGEWAWTREGENWVIEAAGTLPDGSEVTAVNLLIPLGKDAFTWQVVERSAAGSPLPATPPLKVTRVKGKK